MLRFFVLLMTLLTTKATRLVRRVRIIGGTDTNITVIPYQVYLDFQNGNNCGGSIISKNWIITAAHCFPQLSTALNCQIRAGSSYTTKGGKIYNINKIIIHNDFKHNDYNQMINDIALINIKGQFDFDHTRQPIDLYNVDESVNAGDMAIVSGWGNNHSIELLQSVKIAIISKDTCNIFYQFQNGIPDNEICSSIDGNKDACQGDSGGPMAVDGRLAGIVSWGLGCGQYPGVYTEISAYRNWIDERINDKTTRSIVTTIGEIIKNIFNCFYERIIGALQSFY